MRRPVALVAVLVLPLLLLGLAGAALARSLTARVTDRAQDEAVQTTELLARTEIQPRLTAAELARGLTDQQHLALDGALQPVVQGQILRLKVWNREPRVVYSDLDSLMGRRFTPSDELTEALGGRSVSGVMVPDQPENAVDQLPQERLIEIYVPIREPDGRVIGAFELYASYRQVSAAVQRDLTTIYGAVGAAVALLYLALLRMVWDNRRIRRLAQGHRHDATHDSLTGLANRTLFQERLDRAVAGAARSAGGSGLSLVFVDLDDFKAVNDSLGHGAGDALLVHVAAVMRRLVRDGDTVARLGGDEFAVLLHRDAGNGSGELLGLRIQQELGIPVELAGASVRVRASVGTVAWAGESAEELLAAADRAMYEAKARSKPHAAVGAASTVGDRPGRYRELEDAVDNGELRLHYQPVLELGTDRVTGFEALLRWDHPRDGLLLPDRFLPAAERSGQIRLLGEWVLDQVCRQAVEWSAEWSAEWSDEPGRPEGFTVGVNLSPTQLTDLRLPGLVRDAVLRHGLAPERLLLEVGDPSALAIAPGRLLDIADALHDARVRLALTTTGTVGTAGGTASLGLPDDMLKVGRSVLAALDQDPRAAGVLRALLAYSHELGLSAVAEGVEYTDHPARLLDLGYRYGQGYLLGAPAPADGPASGPASGPVAGPAPGPADLPRPRGTRTRA